MAYFAAALEGPAEAPAEGRRTRHQLRVLLLMYAPPSGADSVSSAGTAHGASYVALEDAQDGSLVRVQGVTSHRGPCNEESKQDCHIS